MRLERFNQAKHLDKAISTAFVEKWRVIIE